MEFKVGDFTREQERIKAQRKAAGIAARKFSLKMSKCPFHNTEVHVKALQAAKGSHEAKEFLAIWLRDRDPQVRRAVIEEIKRHKVSNKSRGVDLWSENLGKRSGSEKKEPTISLVSAIKKFERTDDDDFIEKSKRSGDGDEIIKVQNLGGGFINMDNNINDVMKIAPQFKLQAKNGGEVFRSSLSGRISKPKIGKPIVSSAKRVVRRAKKIKSAKGFVAAGKKIVRGTGKAISAGAKAAVVGGKAIAPHLKIGAKYVGRAVKDFARSNPKFSSAVAGAGLGYMYARKKKRVRKFFEDDDSDLYINKQGLGFKAALAGGMKRLGRSTRVLGVGMRRFGAKLGRHAPMGQTASNVAGKGLKAVGRFAQKHPVTSAAIGTSVVAGGLLRRRRQRQQQQGYY